MYSNDIDSACCNSDRGFISVFSCVSLPKFPVRTVCMVPLNTNKIVSLMRTCSFSSFRV